MQTHAMTRIDTIVVTTEVLIIIKYLKKNQRECLYIKFHIIRYQIFTGCRCEIALNPFVIYIGNEFLFELPIKIIFCS